MLIRYDGPHPEIVVDELSQEITIKAGEPTEIPDELAARLLEQSTWSKATKPTPTPAPATPAPTTTETSS